MMRRSDALPGLTAFVRAVLWGSLAGALVLGIGGRALMWAVAVAARGSGAFTLGGSLEVLAAAALFGALGGGLMLLIPGRLGRWRAPLHAAATFGLIALLSAAARGAAGSIAAPGRILALLPFLGLLLLYSLVLARFVPASAFDRPGSSSAGAEPTPIPSIKRIPASASPFGIEVWDCRASTQSMISTTGDPQLAERFLVLRSSAGTEYQDQAMADPQVVRCDLAYPYQGTISDGALFKAAEMEDKWDIYLYRPYLYFARSWSGELRFRATVQPEPGPVRITSIDVERGEDPEFSRRLVDYLIKSHLFGAVVPHPLPAALPPEPDEIAALSFSLFGRRCHYGSYADTTLVRATT